MIKNEVKTLSLENKKQITDNFSVQKNKIIFFDYDGTLVSFKDIPSQGIPDKELLELLSQLALKTEIVLLSGRDKDTLSKWFSDLNINLVAEHGIWIKEKNIDWQIMKLINPYWKTDIVTIFKKYAGRLEGSFIEEKEYSIVFHYSKSCSEITSNCVKELTDELIKFTANIEAQVLVGNKILEVRPEGINKGIAARWFLSKNNYEFILAAGDDTTDEDLFKILPDRKNVYSIKVGTTDTNAKYRVQSFTDIRLLIKKLVLVCLN